MRSLKFSISADGFKGFLARHVEKVVLAMAIVLVAVFFCAGYSVDRLPDKKTPLTLRDKINQVKNHIVADRWPFLKLMRTPDLRHPERVDEGRQSNDEAGYPIASLDTPLIRQKKLRVDPRLYAPIRLEAVANWVPVAYVPGRGETDELQEQPLAVRTKNDKPEVRRVVGSRSRSRGKSRGDDVLSNVSSQVSEDEQFSMNDSLEAGGDYRALTDHQKASLGGFRPSGDAIAKSRFLVAVKAVVPFSLQWQEFEDLKNSSDYDAQRDVPVYRWFYVERAEVPADPAMPLEWKRVGTRDRGLINLEKKGGWVGTPEELADPDSVDPVLTLATPPVLLGSLWPWALHPDIRVRKEPAKEESEASSAAVMDDGPDGPPAASGRESKKNSGQRGNFNAGFARGGFGLGGTNQGDESSLPKPPPKYKLIRFYDTTAQVGKSYRYRIKVQLFDPNRPADAKDDPRIETLSPAVQARLKSLDAAEGANRATYWVESEWSQPSEVVNVEAPPSTVLASAVTPPRETVLPAQGGIRPKFVEREPQAAVVASVWDSALAANVTTELEAYRGSLLDAKKSVDVLHPVTREFHTLDDYSFQTGSMLLDMRGGEPLSGGRTSRYGKGDEFHSPGEFLILDSQGNLQVADEFDDTAHRRRELFLEDTPPVEEYARGGRN